jgi:hypothetical protein
VKLPIMALTRPVAAANPPNTGKLPVIAEKVVPSTRPMSNRSPEIDALAI